MGNSLSHRDNHSSGNWTGPAVPAPTSFFARRDEQRAQEQVNASIARSNRAAEVQAQHDFNQARLKAHRIGLAKEIEKEKNKADAEVAMDMAMHYTTAHNLIGQLAATSHDPALLMGLGEIQAGLTATLRTRMFNRAFEE